MPYQFLNLSMYVSPPGKYVFLNSLILQRYSLSSVLSPFHITYSFPYMKPTLTSLDPFHIILSYFVLSPHTAYQCFYTSGFIHAVPSWLIFIASLLSARVSFTSPVIGRHFFSALLFVAQWNQSELLYAIFLFPLWSSSLTRLLSSPNLSQNMGMFNFQHLPWCPSFISRPIHWVSTSTIWKFPFSSFSLNISHADLTSCTLQKLWCLWLFTKLPGTENGLTHSWHITFERKSSSPSVYLL